MSSLQLAMFLRNRDSRGVACSKAHKNNSGEPKTKTIQFLFTTSIPFGATNVFIAKKRTVTQKETRPNEKPEHFQNFSQSCFGRGKKTPKTSPPSTRQQKTKGSKFTAHPDTFETGGPIHDSSYIHAHNCTCETAFDTCQIGRNGRFDSLRMDKRPSPWE